MSNAIKIESETVKQIKKLFPKPVSCTSKDREGQYCVLGALYKYARLYVPDLLLAINPFGRPTKPAEKTKHLDDSVRLFPGAGEAGCLLKKMNCSLDDQTATNLASDVLRLNDDRKFGQAWGKLSEALTYDPNKCV